MGLHVHGLGEVEETMSDSRKDGAYGGGHRDHQCKEFWSRRCRKVNGERMNKYGKRLTHRAERRANKRIEFP